MENKQQKDFDQFFQDKLNNREFDYQDDFWKEMETQLPEAKTATATSAAPRRLTAFKVDPPCADLVFVAFVVFRIANPSTRITGASIVAVTALRSTSEPSFTNSFFSVLIKAAGFTLAMPALTLDAATASGTAMVAVTVTDFPAASRRVAAFVLLLSWKNTLTRVAVVLVY